MIPGKSSRRSQALESQAMHTFAGNDEFDDFGIPRKTRESQSSKKTGLFSRFKRNNTAPVDESDEEEEDAYVPTSHSFQVAGANAMNGNANGGAPNGGAPNGGAPLSMSSSFASQTPSSMGGPAGGPAYAGSERGFVSPPPPSSVSGGSQHEPSGDISMDQISSLRDRHRYPPVSDDPKSGNGLTSMSNYDSAPVIPTLGNNRKHNTNSGDYRHRMIESRRAIQSSQAPSAGSTPPRASSRASLVHPLPNHGPGGPPNGFPGGPMGPPQGFGPGGPQKFNPNFQPGFPPGQGFPPGPNFPPGQQFPGGPHGPPGFPPFAGPRGGMPPGQFGGAPPNGFPPQGFPPQAFPPQGVPYGAPYGMPHGQPFVPNGLPNQPPNTGASGPPQGLPYNQSPQLSSPALSLGGSVRSSPTVEMIEENEPAEETGDDTLATLDDRGSPLQRKNSDFDFGPTVSVFSPGGTETVQRRDVLDEKIASTGDHAPSAVTTDAAPAADHVTMPKVAKETAELEKQVRSLEEDLRVMSIELSESVRRELSLDPGNEQLETVAALAKAQSDLALERVRRATAERVAHLHGVPTVDLQEKLAEVEYHHNEAVHLLTIRTNQYESIKKERDELQAGLETKNSEHTDLQARGSGLDASVQGYQQEEQLSRQVQTLEKENAKLRQDLARVMKEGTQGDRVIALEEQRSALQEALRAMRERKDAEIQHLNHRIEALTINQQRIRSVSASSLRGEARMSHTGSMLNMSTPSTPTDEEGDGGLAMPRLREPSTGRAASPLHIGLGYSK